MKEFLQLCRTFFKTGGFWGLAKKAFTKICIRPYRKYVRGSYSQSGEDLLIDQLLGHKEFGFYVDIGANHPIRSNNTMRFYKRGWNGINIEPSPDSFEKITRKRKRDVNLNIGIAEDKTTGLLYCFLPDAISTFSRETAAKRMKDGFRLAGKKEVELYPLSEVLYKYCGDNPIDFMSIDTEGYDMQVLRSNDWDSFRPLVLCIESIDPDQGHRFLVNLGYEMVRRVGANTIYK